ncbi:MAG: enolase C-terminal domain-like protein [Thermaerobacterales bacterium]
MKITDVKITPISIQRSGKPLVTSYSAQRATQRVSASLIVEIMTDEGLVGIGQTAAESPAYGESVEGIIVNTRAHLAPAVIGESPLNIEHLNRKLRAALPHHWASHAGVELALWDLKGKALGVPVYQLLGGKVRDGVDLMGFVSHGDPSDMAEEASATLAATPFPVLKMKIGINMADDIARVRAVAEAIGDRSVLQVDGNTGYTISQAIPALTAMAATGALGTIEQPVKRIDELAEIARRIPVPVMADEAIYAPDDAVEVVRQRAASIALMKITKHGGILNVQKIAAVCESAGIILSVAVYSDLIAVAAAHVAAAIPCVKWPSPPTQREDTILTELVKPDGLVLRVPEGPGFGVELDQEKMKAYALDL